jgi:hypothetical protein
MTLDSGDAVKKALGVPSLDDLSDEKMLELVALLPNISEAVQSKLIEQIPGFQKIALDAVNAVEQTFEKTVESDTKSHTELHESLGDIREAIKGRLARDDISEAHAQYLVDKLIETGHMEIGAVTEKRKFLASEANATRIAGIVQAGLPIVTTVIVTGARIMMSRGAPRV